MGVDFTASAACDKCGKKAMIRVVFSKLRPQPEMHLRLPEGWGAASLEDSGDLYITCPECPPVLVTVPPAAPQDLAMEPTVPPPPPGDSSE